MRRVRHDAQHFVFGFAYAHATYGVAGEVHGDELFQGCLAQAFKHAALHDSKQGVGIIQTSKLVLASPCPA